MSPEPSPTETFESQYLPLASAVVAWASLRLPAAARTQVGPEDLAQEVWLRGLRRFHTFDPQRMTFRFWLFAVAKNVLLEVQRQAMRRQRERPAGGDTQRLLALADVPAMVTSLTQRLARDETIRAFLANVDQLDERERQTVLHCGLEELSLEEAAQRLDEPYDTTRKRWGRLRDRMRGWAFGLELLSGA